MVKEMRMPSHRNRLINRTLPFIIMLILFFVCSRAYSDDNWVFEVTPYLWFAGINGNLTPADSLPAAPVQISAKNAIDDTNIAFMLFMEAKKQRHGILIDFVYSDVRSTETSPDPINLTIKSKSQSTIYSLAYEYEIYKQGQFTVDIFGGGRYWRIKSKLDFSGGLGILDGQSLSGDKSWIDMLVGFKVLIPLTDSRFYLLGTNAYGGFGVGASSEHFYDVAASVGYRWSDNIGTAIGYRVYDVDYDRGGFVYDVKQKGWNMSLTWKF